MMKKTDPVGDRLLETLQPAQGDEFVHAVRIAAVPEPAEQKCRGHAGKGISRCTAGRPWPDLWHGVLRLIAGEQGIDSGAAKGETVSGVAVVEFQFHAGEFRPGQCLADTGQQLFARYRRRTVAGRY